LDNGFCQYGQLFDPSTGRCRDIYCQELNYRFNGTTCIPDENKNSTQVYKRMSDIDVSLTLMIAPRDHFERGNFSKRLNSQMNKTCANDWNRMFHDTLHGEFCIFNRTRDRILCLFFLGYLSIDYERITKIDYSLIQTEDEHLVKRSIIDSENNNTARIIYSNISSDNYINNTLSNNGSVTINSYFSIADRNETSNDTLTGLHVVTLLLLASEYNVILDLCEKYSIKVESLSIVSDKNKTQEEFCSDPDVMYPTKNGILRRRISSDGEIDYVVDIPELETTYEGGDYTYLFIVSTLTQQKPATQSMVFNNKNTIL
jgi:hypothetical protein